MGDPKKGSGSSQSNGANERASDAAKSENLDKGQQEQLQRALEDRGESLTYQQIREIAQEIKEGG